MLDLTNKSVVITGGAGFLGSQLALAIENQHPGCHVTVFDRFRDDKRFPNNNLTSLGHFKNLIDFHGHVIAGDINQSDDIQRLRAIDFDYMIHFAAISDTTVLNELLMVQTNLNAFTDLLDLCAEKSAAMIYASSAATYGNTPAPNRVGENEQPENVYGFSKVMMDRFVEHYSRSHPQLQITGFRYFNVYGHGENYKGKTASMILQLGLQILDGKQPRLFKYGEQMRDFVYIDDVVNAHLLAMESGVSGTFNVGSGKARQFKDIVTCLNSSLGTDAEIEYIDNPYTAAYQNHTEADISDTTDKLGYQPLFTLEKGVQAYTDEIRRIHQHNLFQV
ncbi:MAG: ADP-glyceromanno-heptose 6-epimerase [Gammaproteobacteria bacterium]|nr:ADP-glyceromanno-heptose 6-epimerase [Gammaproteobacteria bacterium]